MRPRRRLPRSRTRCPSSTACPRTVIFGGAVLDRAPLERKRPEWLAEQRADPRARAILMSERGIWIDGSGLLLARPSNEAVFLGLASGAPLFADDVRDSEPAAGHPAGLREAAA